MRKFLTLIMLTLSMLAFSQKSNDKYYISRYAKVQSDGSFEYKEFNGYVNFKFDDSNPNYVDVHFCAIDNHYDFVVLPKNSTSSTGEKFNKFDMRVFVIKDYNIESTKEFDLKLVQWSYPETGKIYLTLTTVNGTYHYQLSKVESYKEGKLIESIDITQ